MADSDDRVTPRIPRAELDDAEGVPDLPEREQMDSEVMTEGSDLPALGIVGGESRLPIAESVQNSLSSTTGKVDVEGRSITGAIGNVGSERTTAGPDDDIQVEDESPYRSSGSTAGSPTDAAPDEE